MMTIEEKASSLMEAEKENLSNLKVQRQLFAVKDVKSGRFAAPFIADNIQVAKRNVAWAMKDPTTAFAVFPEDYQLFKLGSFDEQTGELVSDVLFVANLTEFKSEVKDA